MKKWIILGILVIVIFSTMNWLEIYHKEITEAHIYPDGMGTSAQQVRAGAWGIDIRDSPLLWGD